MTLHQTQRAFMAEIAADDGTQSSSLGMAIYRSAYRGRLAEALAVTYERTRRRVGEDMFDLAATHHILTHPPCTWTLDAYGANFPATLATLFAEDPEVPELAWLEWHMQQAFAAPDRPVLTPADLAGAGLEGTDWDNLRLDPAAGLASRAVEHDLAALWHAAGLVCPVRPQPDPAILLVWRNGLSPHFRLLLQDEFTALSHLLGGASFGAVASGVGAEGLAQFGQWFAGWLGEGLFSGLRS